MHRDMKGGWESAGRMRERGREERGKGKGRREKHGRGLEFPDLGFEENSSVAEL